MRISDWSSDVCSSDLVVRREFRLNEGDAFNSFGVKRTESRINSLGYFQENLEIERKEGSAPDRIILETNVEEKPTGEPSLSAGFSSIENFQIGSDTVCNPAPNAHIVSLLCPEQNNH